MVRSAYLSPTHLTLAALVVAALSLALVAQAGNPFCYVPAAPETTRAYQYAAMSDALCFAELHERKVPFERAEVSRRIAKHVQAPIRLTGPVHGVRYLQTYREGMDPKAPSTIMDCRLALAIDDLSRILSRENVVEVQYMSLYRTGHYKPGVRHPAGRAIDVATAKKKDGTVFSVHKHFFGRTGAQTCGKGAAKPRRNHPGAFFWRRVSCELDNQRVFNLVLTPNYNWGHRDHLHLEVRSGISWYLTQ